jgi:hypothetical protein
LGGILLSAQGVNFCPRRFSSLTFLPINRKRPVSRV